MRKRQAKKIMLNVGRKRYRQRTLDVAIGVAGRKSLRDRLMLVGVVRWCRRWGHEIATETREDKGVIV